MATLFQRRTPQASPDLFFWVKSMTTAKIKVEIPDTVKMEDVYKILDRVVRLIHKNLYDVKASWDGDDIEQ